MELRPGMFVFVDGKRSRVNRTQTRSKVAGKEYAREFCVHCSRRKQTQRKELLLKFVRIELLFLSTNVSFDERFFEDSFSPFQKKKNRKKGRRRETTKKNEIEIESWKMDIRFIVLYKIFLLLSRGRHAARIFENISSDRWKDRWKITIDDGHSEKHDNLAKEIHRVICSNRTWNEHGRWQKPEPLRQQP